MRKKRGILVTALAGGLALAATSAEANGVLKVENGDDLVAKILQANADPQIKNIKCIGHGACDYTGALPTFTGPQDLKIDLKGSTIDASGVLNEDAFSATGGGNLKLKRMNIIGGGMSGIYVRVPPGKEDDLRVRLQRVSVSGADLHGMHIDDSAGAAAGVRLALHRSRFVGNGLGADAQDGLYVEENGDGQVLARVLHSSFKDNGSDGLSLDENGDGDVVLTVIKGRFLRNGENPGNFDKEDGLDVDETGNGDVWFTILHSRFNENFDDGVDIDERDAGNLFGMMNHVEANNNEDLGLTFDEQQVGDLNVTVKNSTAVDNDLSGQIDIVASQQNGTGTLTLKKVTTGNVDVTGVNLVTLP